MGDVDITFSNKEDANIFLLAAQKKYGINIAGLDEVGRGPLFGPVVVGCVLLPDRHEIQGIRDSKKLSAKKRERIADEIMEVAVWGIGACEADEIDKINIHQAIRKAAQDAIFSAAQKINIDYLICDGGIDLQKLITIPTTSVIKGDNWFECISAASIVAKVYHDRQMLFYDELYPEYGLKNSMGYGTKQHLEAIEKYGITPLHRRSFGRCRNAKVREYGQTY